MSNSYSNESLGDRVASVLGGTIALGLLAFTMPGLIASWFGWTANLAALQTWISGHSLGMECILYLLYGLSGLFATFTIVGVPLIPVFVICEWIEKQMRNAKQQGYVVKYHEHDPPKKDSRPVVVQFRMIRRTIISHKRPGS